MTQNTGIAEAAGKSRIVLVFFAGIAIISVVVGILSGIAPDFMIALISAILWLFCLVLLVRLGSFKVISPVALFFIFYTLFMYIGGLVLFFNNGEGAPLTTGQRNYSFLLGITSGLLALCLGAVLGNIVTGYKPNSETNDFRKKPWSDTLKGDSFGISLGLLALGAIAMTLVFVLSRGVLPLIQSLANFGTEGVYQASVTGRLQFTGYGEGIGEYFYQGYFGQFYKVVLPFTALFALAKYLSSRNRTWLFWWLVLSLIAAFFLLLSLQRWLILFFILLTFLVYHLYQFRMQKGPLIAVTAVAAITYLSVSLIRGITNLGIMLWDFSMRIIYGQVVDMYSVFELFPRYVNFRNGQLLYNDFLAVLPGPAEGSGRWIMLALRPDSPTGSSTAMGAVGELYANFGMVGIILGMFIFGLVMQLALIWFVRGRKTLLRLVVFASFTLASGWLCFAGIVGGLFDGTIVGFIICAVAVIILTSVLTIKPGTKRG